MAHHFVFIMAMLVLGAAESHGSLTPEVYWRSMLSNTPMPKAIREHLSSGAKLREPVTFHDVKLLLPLYSKDADQSTVFLERDLRVGARFDVIFKRPVEGDYFLSRRAADSIPFSYGKLPEILDLFSITPRSFEAEKMEVVLRACEAAPLPGVKKHCATSLESMLDFVTFNLNATSKHTVIKALSPTPEKETPSMQPHTVASFSAAATETTVSVVCHVQAYPYTVYHCHTDASTLPYIVRFVRESDGSTVEATAMCHHDTSDWDPDFHVLQRLKVSPGGDPVCHILPVGDIAFLPTSAAAVVPGDDNIAVQ